MDKIKVDIVGTVKAYLREKPLKKKHAMILVILRELLVNGRMFTKDLYVSAKQEIAPNGILHYSKFVNALEDLRKWGVVKSIKFLGFKQYLWELNVSESERIELKRLLLRKRDDDDEEFEEEFEDWDWENEDF